MKVDLALNNLKWLIYYETKPNQSFKMEFLPSKKIPHADGLLRLIPEIREPLEETVTTSLSSKMDIK